MQKSELERLKNERGKLKKKAEREHKAQLKQSGKKCQHNSQMDLGSSVQR